MTRSPGKPHIVPLSNLQRGQRMLRRAVPIPPEIVAACARRARERRHITVDRNFRA